MSRILYVTHRVPFPPNRGDRIRTYNILKRLGQQADVYLACLADEPVDESTREELARWTKATAIIPHSGRGRWLRAAKSMAFGHAATEGIFQSTALRRVVRRWADEVGFDAAMASSSGVAAYVLPPMVSSTTRVWIDLIDVDSQKWSDCAEIVAPPKRWLYALEAHRLRKLECTLTKRARRMLVVSESERQVLRLFCSFGSVQVISNGVDTDYFKPTAGRPESLGCSFVGVLNYRPNSDAVDWFVRHVWPRIHAEHPEAEFNVVGRFPTPEILALDAVPGVNIVGEVADVRPWLNQATAVVVPLRVARGVQNKVLEAMAAGCPIVASPAPLEGLGVEPGAHLLQARTPEEWFQCVTRLFADSALRDHLGRAARQFVVERCQWDTALEPLIEFINGEDVGQVAGLAEAVR